MGNLLQTQFRTRTVRIYFRLALMLLSMVLDLGTLPLPISSDSLLHYIFLQCTCHLSLIFHYFLPRHRAHRHGTGPLTCYKIVISATRFYFPYCAHSLTKAFLRSRFLPNPWRTIFSRGPRDTTKPQGDRAPPWTPPPGAGRIYSLPLLATLPVSLFPQPIANLQSPMVCRKRVVGPREGRLGPQRSPFSDEKTVNAVVIGKRLQQLIHR